MRKPCFHNVENRDSVTKWEKWFFFFKLPHQATPGKGAKALGKRPPCPGAGAQQEKPALQPKLLLGAGTSPWKLEAPVL